MANLCHAVNLTQCNSEPASSNIGIKNLFIQWYYNNYLLACYPLATMEQKLLCVNHSNIDRQEAEITTQTNEVYVTQNYAGALLFDHLLKMVSHKICYM